MDPSTTLDQIAITAQMRESAASATALRGAKGKKLNVIAGAVIDSLALQSAVAARAVLPSPLDLGVERVWAGVVESLQASGLSPRLICTKSGRISAHGAPDVWRDYLAQILHLGDTQAGDVAQAALVGAIEVQKAFHVLPPFAVVSAHNLAMIRQTSAADFVLIALGDIFPIGSKASAAERARRGEMLADARAAILDLPPSAVQYACECLTLYLSYIAPHKISGSPTALDFYGQGAFADLAAPWQSIATVGHFCGRIVQQMVAFLASATLRPIAKLTASDMATLRVHYQGLTQYRDMRKIRQAMKSAKDAQANVKTKTRYNADTRAVDRALRDLPETFGAGLDLNFLDALDLSAAVSTSGRHMPVILQTDTQARSVVHRRAGLQAIRAALDSDNAGGEDLDFFDLSSVLAGGMPEDFAPEYEDLDELAADGLIDLDLMESEEHIDLADDESEDSEDILTRFAMSQATSKLRRGLISTRAKEKALQASVVDGLLGRFVELQSKPQAVAQIAPAPAPAPLRRVIVAPAPSAADIATATALESALAKPAPLGIARRVVK
jgi:hypothetical protein